MRADQLLDELESLGLALSERNGALVVSPVDRLTDDLRGKIRAAREDLLDLLQAREQEAATRKLWSREPVTGRPPGLTDPVAPDLAGWFTSARSAGTLPAEPFALRPAVRVSDPERLYDWIAGVIARGDRGASAREAEEYLRFLRGNSHGKA